MQEADGKTVQLGSEGIVTEDWVRIIKEEGKGFLFGKFLPEWRVNGNVLGDPVRGRGSAGQDFATIGIFGGIEDLDLHAKKVRLVMQALSRQEGNLHSTNERNHLIVDNPPEIKYQQIRGVDMDWKIFYYAPKAEFDPRLDSRSAVDPEFIFLLPVASANAFLAKIKETPDLINDVFDGIFAGLVKDDQLKLKPISILGLLEITDDIRERIHPEGKFEPENPKVEPQDLRFSIPQ